MTNILPISFYERDPVIVAQELLGCVMVREINHTKLAGMIVETEAYVHGDPACHAYDRMTKRNAALFGRPGHAYIYMIHTHHCVNAVAHTADQKAGGVLIRAIMPLEGIELMARNRGMSEDHMSLTNGPGKLTEALGISKELYGHDLTQIGSLYITRPANTESIKIIATPRIGISKAQDKMWRFYIADNPWVSKR